MNLDMFEDGDMRNAYGPWQFDEENPKHIQRTEINRSLNEILQFSSDPNHRFMHCPIFIQTIDNSSKLRFNIDFFDNFKIKKLTSEIFEVLSNYYRLDDIFEFDCRDVLVKDIIDYDLFQPIKNSISEISFVGCNLPNLPKELFSSLRLKLIHISYNQIDKISNTLGLSGIKELFAINFSGNNGSKLIEDDLSFFDTNQFRDILSKIRYLAFEENKIKNSYERFEKIVKGVFKSIDPIDKSII